MQASRHSDKNAKWYPIQPEKKILHCPLDRACLNSWRQTLHLLRWGKQLLCCHHPLLAPVRENPCLCDVGCSLLFIITKKNKKKQNYRFQKKIAHCKQQQAWPSRRQDGAHRRSVAARCILVADAAEEPVAVAEWEGGHGADRSDRE